MIHHQNIRDPIEYVIDEYFKKKKLAAIQYSEGTSNSNYKTDNDLPEVPLTIFRNDEGKAYKFVYGNVGALDVDEEADPLLWMEELIRDADELIIGVKTTYPDGSEVINDFIKNADGKLEEIR